MTGRLKNAALLACVLAAALGGACGPATPAVETPPTPTAPSTGDVPPAPVPTSEPTASATTVPATPPAPTTKEAPPAAGPGASQPVKPSALLAEVVKAGIDVTKIADMDKMPLAQKKKIMPFFQKALGYDKCTGCHAKEGDFKTETRNMKIGEGCYKNFVAALRDEKGGTLFCDSCHGGKAKMLDRSNKEALKTFMDVEYVKKLSSADKKKDHECSSCHGDALELKIFEKLWAVKL